MQVVFPLLYNNNNNVFPKKKKKKLIVYVHEILTMMYLLITREFVSI